MAYQSNIQHWGTFTLRDLVEEVVSALDSRIGEQGIETVIDIPIDQMVTTDRGLLERGVHNLILNAIDAVSEGGSIVITSAEGPYGVELEVADSGPMLTEQQRREAFELVPTEQRAGAGWGLAVVRRIAELIGGGVEAVNCPEGGAAFTLRIPHPVALQAVA